MPFRLSALSLLLCGLIACSSQEPPPQMAVPHHPDASSTSLDMSPVPVLPQPSGLSADWAKGAVFMEIYVRGYQDSNGDGIGDFKGLTSRLDYLASLGVQGIWLMPINASQDHDHGYAVTDYRKLEPDYGSEADFKAFLAAAHARGIGVIMDYVINHSAYQNPLFLDSKNKLNDKRDWYVWSDHDPGWVNWDQSSTWHRARPGRDFYYGVFWEQMPDFNLKNPKVLAYHHDSLRYWLNLGVDGFRFDAVGQLIENGRNAYESQPENKPLLHDLQQLVTQSYSGRFMICEEPNDPTTAASKEACGSAFAFGFNEALRDSVKAGKVTTELQQKLTSYPLSQMGLVLGTHDSYAGERLIEDFKGDLARYKLAVATQLTLPGQPFIYYGEEIGMGHSEGNSGDWGLRAPMSWDSHGGFSSAPLFRAPASNLAQYNAQTQQTTPNSLWHFYQHWIALRKAHPALRLGDMQLLRSDKVLAFTRSTKDERLLVAINYSTEPQEIELPLKGSPHVTAIEGQAKQLTCHTATHCQLQIQGTSIALYRLP